VFAAATGFLLGSLLYSGHYTLRWEPQAKPAYGLIGAGLVTSVAINTWADYVRDVSDWFMTGTVITYGFVTGGLVILARCRRREHEQRGEQAMGGDARQLRARSHAGASDAEPAARTVADTSGHEKRDNARAGGPNGASRRASPSSS
jgi:hypothetical protein